MNLLFLIASFILAPVCESCKTEIDSFYSRKGGHDTLLNKIESM